MTEFLPTLIVLVVVTMMASLFIPRFGRDEQPILWVSLIAHQVAAVGSVLISKYVYVWGDMLSYHQFGVAAAERLRVDFWGLAPGLVGLLFHRTDPIPLPLAIADESTGAMQAASAFAMLLCFNSLYAACSLIAGFAFLSKGLLYQVAREELPDIPRRPLLFACTLLPSALFWSCALLKEPLAMIGLLLAVYGWHQAINKRNPRRSLVLVALSSVLVILIKGYIFPVFCLAIGAWHLARTIQDRRGDVALKTGHMVLAAIVVGILVVGTGIILPRFATSTITDQLAGMQATGADVEGGSAYVLGQSSGTAGGQAALAPLGLLTALFRPLIFEVKSATAVLSAIEMTGFVLATIVVLLRRGILSSFSELVKRPFLSFCFSFVVIFGTCVGLGTTNLGTLVRYRMPMLPFFAILLLTLLARPRPEPNRLRLKAAVHRAEHVA